MRAMVLNGSPKHEGNSATLARFFCNGLEKSGVKDICHFYINEMKIQTCQMCMSCRHSE